MAHKKAGGSKARQGGNVAGKRMGTKVFGGSTVNTGSIIVRQRGRVFIPGKNVKMGTDFTIFSMIKGVVEFAWYNKDRKKINVIPVTDAE